MKWHEVREMYPNQFVEFEIVEYHEDEKSKYVDEVAVIKAIKDGREAMKKFTKCKNGQLVYSTENESIVIFYNINRGKIWKKQLYFLLEFRYREKPKQDYSTL